MRNYGIDKKIRQEDIKYLYAKCTTKLRSILPGKNRKYRKEFYDVLYKEDTLFRKDNNSLPDDNFFKLDQIITSDLVLKEDVNKLKAGIKKLLKVYGGGKRFLSININGFDETYSRIDRIDSELTGWYRWLKCGVFEFHGEAIHADIDYFTISISNVNRSYMSVKFQVHLTKNKLSELDEIIRNDFHDSKGYAHKSLSYKKGGGARERYTVIHYNDERIKADKIFEWISSIEWEFYSIIKKYLPLVLHDKGIMPPRIEVFYTDLDYRDDSRFFWNSIGIEYNMGQILDDRQRIYFMNDLSGRYDEGWKSYIKYIIIDDDIEAGQMKSVKDQVFFHMEDYSGEYFKFLFLELITKETKKLTVEYKHKLDRIKLRKGKLKRLLKLRYLFERNVDPFIRYSGDEIWENSIKRLENEIYSDNPTNISDDDKWTVTYKDFAYGIVSESKRTNIAIESLRTDFDDKRQVLQHLADYKNSIKNLWLNVMMFLIAMVTLFFVIFPEKAGWVAESLKHFISFL